MRVNVQINICESFQQGKYLRLGDGSRKWVAFTYEKMPVYCFFCGLVGHLERKCHLRFREDFVDPGREFQYGE